MAEYRLIVDSACDYSEYNYITEEANNKASPNLYITGPFMAAEEVNRNKRIYSESEMDREVNRFITEKVNNRCALGELNHPPSADINLERSCHMITNLQRDGNVWIGKSKVLKNPCGNILKSLIEDEVRVGMSTRCLGQLNEGDNGVSRVKNMRLITVDAVADPSYSKAFVNGILESKVYNVDFSETEAAYEDFEKSMRILPVKGKEEYFMQKICEFMGKLKNI